MPHVIRADDSGSDPSRRTRRELERISERAQLGRAEMEARLSRELARTVGDEHIAQAVAHQRVRGGYDLADHATTRATHLNNKINQACRDNPGLELVLRDVETRVAIGAGITIYNYMTRPES